MIRYKKKSGIARITWDMPDRAVNVINNESKAAFCNGGGQSAGR